jgi:hypothetical protein
MGQFTNRRTLHPHRIGTGNLLNIHRATALFEFCAQPAYAYIPLSNKLTQNDTKTRTTASQLPIWTKRKFGLAPSDAAQPAPGLQYRLVSMAAVDTLLPDSPRLQPVGALIHGYKKMATTGRQLDCARRRPERPSPCSFAQCASTLPPPALYNGLEPITKRKAAPCND